VSAAASALSSAYLLNLIVELVDVVEEGEVLVLRLQELGHQLVNVACWVGTIIKVRWSGG
jgi:hypothetical protein